jgi:hypothetical protein
MVLELIALGFGIYIIAHKVKGRKEKKRALKAQEASRHGPVRVVPIIDTAVTEDLPAYQNDKLPLYESLEQYHPALRNNDKGAGVAV